MPKPIAIRAPGKLVLLGEYAVLEGAPAIVMAVDREALVTLEPAPRFSLRAPDVVPGEVELVHADGRWRAEPAAPQLELVLRCLDEAWPAAGQLAPARIDLDTSSFSSTGPPAVKLGFGSSAAVGAALVSAALRHAGVEPGPTELFTRALRAHRAFQGGAGSGVDLAASVHGGVLRYELRGDAAPLCRAVAMPPELVLVVVWVGEPASTSAMLAALERFQARSPIAYTGHMNELRDIATAGCEAFEAQRVEQWLDHVDAYRAALARLGDAAEIPIVSAAHQKAAAVASSHGAVYKPSGAGGGDLGVAFCSDATAARQLEDSLSSAGLRVIRTALCPRGAGALGSTR